MACGRFRFLAIVKFLIVTVIIYPALPNREFTAYRLNPSQIWQIVMVVSSVGFPGYFLTRKFGHRVGLWLSGLLGGIVSSTAVSVAAGRIAQKDETLGTALAFAALFVGLTILTGFVRKHVGGSGVLFLAGVVGVADVDPFILSVVHGEGAASTLTCRAVLVAVMSNTLMKGVYFGVLAGPVRGLAIRRYALWALLHLPLLWAV